MLIHPQSQSDMDESTPVQAMWLWLDIIVSPVQMTTGTPLLIVPLIIGLVLTIPQGTLTFAGII